MESRWVPSSPSVLFLDPEGARTGSESHGAWERGLMRGRLWGHAFPCAASPLPCLNPWLFWELLATTYSATNASGWGVKGETRCQTVLLLDIQDGKPRGLGRREQEGGGAGGDEALQVLALLLGRRGSTETDGQWVSVSLGSSTSPGPSCMGLSLPSRPSLVRSLYPAHS